MRNINPQISLYSIIRVKGTVREFRLTVNNFTSSLGTRPSCLSFKSPKAFLKLCCTTHYRLLGADTKPGFIKAQNFCPIPGKCLRAGSSGAGNISSDHGWGLLNITALQMGKLRHAVQGCIYFTKMFWSSQVSAVETQSRTRMPTNWQLLLLRGSPAAPAGRCSCAARRLLAGPCGCSGPWPQVIAAQWPLDVSLASAIHGKGSISLTVLILFKKKNPANPLDLDSLLVQSSDSSS